MMIIGMIAKTEEAYMQIVKVLKSSKKEIIIHDIASTISSSISLKSFVRRLTTLPTGTLLKKFERLAYRRLFII